MKFNFKKPILLIALFAMSVFPSLLKAQSAFTPGNLVVEAVGSSATTVLSSASTQINFWEFVPSTGAVAQSITANTTTMSESGSAGTAGCLTLSADGTTLVFVAYNEAPGVTKVTSSTVNRGVGFLAQGSSPTPTIATYYTFSSTGTGSTDGYWATSTTGNNIKGAYFDGTTIWSTGNEANGGSSIHTSTVTSGGPASPNTQVTTNAALTATCGIGVYKDQLYIEQSNGTGAIYQVGTGKPTSSSATATTIATGTAMLNAVFLNVSNTNPGHPDVIYFTDQAKTGLLHKLYWNTGTSAWAVAGTSVIAATSVVGGYITADMNSNGGIDLYAVMNEGTTSSYIIKCTDVSPITTLASSITPSTILTAPGYELTGINWAPSQTTAISASNWASTLSSGNFAGGNYGDITIPSGVTATLTGNIYVNGTLTVQSGGTLKCGNYFVFSPKGSFGTCDLQSGATLETKDDSGITNFTATGSIQCFSRFYSKGANYIYDGTVAQYTGNGLSSANSLIVNNSNGLTLTSPISVADSLTLTAGTLAIGNNKLTIASSGTIIGASASKYIVISGTGTVEMTAGTSGLSFPVGVTDYNPIKIATTSSTATIDASLSNSITNNTNVALTNHAVNRTWTITSLATTTLIVTPQWDNSADLAGASFLTSYNNVASRTSSSSWVPSQSAGAATVVSGTLYDRTSGNIAMIGSTNYQVGVLDSTSGYNALYKSGNLIVERVGFGGSTATSTASGPIELIQVSSSGGKVDSVAINNSGNLRGTRMVDASSATSAGRISLSSDGQHILFVGYDTAVNVAGVSTTALTITGANGPYRMVGMVDANENVTMPTGFPNTAAGAYYTNAIRGACSDGLLNSGAIGIWTSGADGSSTAKSASRYTSVIPGTISATGVAINTTLSATGRCTEIFKDQLYISNSTGVYALGSTSPSVAVKPTSLTSTTLNLGTSGDPYEFVVLDVDSTTSGPELMYLTSYASGTVGLYKFYYNGSAWVAPSSNAVYTISVGGSAAGFASLGAARNTTTGGIDIYAVVGSGANNAVMKFTDNSAYNAGLNIASPTTLATAGQNYVFRGLAWAPTQTAAISNYSYAPTNGTSIAAGNYDNITIGSGVTATLGGNITIDGTLTVQNGGTLICGNNIISSPPGTYGTFDLNNGGTIQIGSANGITRFAASGNIQTFSRFFRKGANYIYNGSAAQHSGNGITNALNLTVNNSNGLTMDTSCAVSGVFTFTSGSVTLGSNKLTITSTGSIAGATSAKYIITNGTGTLEMTAGTTGLSFPVGNTSTNYNPVKVSTTTSTATFDVLVSNGITTSNNVAGTDHSVKRTWSVTPTSTTIAVVTPQWDGSKDLTGADFLNSYSFVSSRSSATPSYATWVQSQAPGADVNVSGTLYNLASGNIAMTSASTYLVGVFDSASAYNAIDAGVYKVQLPTVNACVGATPVKVLLRNYGSTTLTSATIGWTVNRVAQTPFSVTSASIPSFSTLSVTIGSYTFAAGKDTIKAWAYSPNGKTDSVAINDTAISNITVNALPAAGVAANTTLCAGTAYSIGAALVTGSTYSWSPSTGLSSTTSSNPSATPTSTTVYTVTETNSAGCSASNSITYTAKPLPAAAAGTSSSVCAGEPAFTIGATSVTGSTYAWGSTPSGITSTISNPSVQPTSTTTYTVTETGTNGCSNSNSIKVTVNALPSASVVASTTICAGTPTSIGATSVTGSTYSWGSSISGFSSSVSNPSVAPTSTATYTLTETNANGCVKSNSLTLTVNALPVAAAGSPSTICAGVPAFTIGATAVTGSTYSWASSLGGFSSTVSNPSVSPASTATYTVTETNTNGCSKTNTVTITVNALPAASVISSTAICVGGSISIGATAVTGSSYSWASTISGFSSTVSNPSVNPASTATYTLTETNANTCVKSNTVTITVNALPAAAVSSAKTICAGTAVSIGAATVTGSSYSWASSITGYSSTVSNPSVTPASSATYTLTETNSNGCINSNSVSITVNPVPAAATAANQAVCPGTPVSLGATAVTGDTYSWASSLGGFSSTSSNPTITPSSTATYTLTETITATGCQNSDTIKVFVNPAPSAVTGSNTTICAGNTLKIGGTAVAGNSYSWTSSSGFTSTVSNPNVTPASTTTYTLTESVSGSCATTHSLTITVNALPAANAGSNASVCAGSTATIGATAVTGDTYSWTSDPSGYTSTSSTASVTPTATTTYILTESNPNTSCSNTNLVEITVNPLPTANAGSNASICKGTSITIGATAITGHTYSWLSTPSGLSATTSNPTVNPASTTSYTLTEKITASGCTNSNSITVNVNPLPAAAAGSASTVCAGSSATIGATAVTGDTYSWTSVPSGYTSTSANPSAPTSVNTTYTLVETITATGCTNTNSVSVTLNALPAAKAGSSSTICAGQPASIGGAAVAGSTYAWASVPTGFGSTLSANTVSPTATTIYTLTETNASGCVNFNTVTVTVNTSPAANISASSSAICAGTSATLNTSSGVSGSLYQWYQNGNAISGATNSGYSASTQGNYYEIITNSGCSTKSNFVNIKVNPLPNAVVQLSKIPTICQGDSVAIVTSLDSNETYQWSNLAASPSIITGATSFAFWAKTTGRYQVMITTLAGCSDTATSVPVTVNPLPTATISASGSTTFCNGGSVKLSTNTTSGINYAWYSDNTAISGATTSSYTATTSGSYSLQMVDATTGCSNISSAVAVTVNSLPAANVTALGNISFCQGGNVILVTDYDPAYTYKWSNAGGALTGETKDTITVKQSGSYTVTATNGNSCSVTSTGVTVTVSAAPAISITKPTSTAICQGTTLALNATSGLKSYQWLLNGSSITGATTASYTVSQSGTYEVLATNTAGCSADDTLSITVNPTPVAGFITPTNTICVGSAGVFANQSYITSGATLTYNWTFGDGSSSTAANVVHPYTTAGTYNVQLTAASTKGCFSTAKVVMTVLPVNSSAFTTSGLGYERIVFHASDNTGASYLWNFGDSTTGSAKAEYHQYASSGTYSVTLTVTNANGCTSTTTSSVTVKSSGVDPVATEDVTINVFPNPFQTQTNVVYNLSQSASVAIEVFDMIGKRVAFVDNTRQIAGPHTYIFNGPKPGTYFIKMMIDDKLYVNKVVQQ